MVELAQRRVAFDGNGRLCASQGDQISVAAEQLYAVVVVWGVDEALAWVGWLTTTTHRTVCFSEADLADPAFRAWLDVLPGWDRDKLSLATTRPGLHLVWRRQATMEIRRL